MSTPAKKRPSILVVNDDGINAPGIAALIRAMDELGDVLVVAPIEEQSAVGHAITLHGRVLARSCHVNGELSHVRALGITGTPADCVKLALNSFLQREPDLVVSGINKGANTAINVIYSGTVSAATESSIRGVDSIAFSLCTKEDADYEPAARYAKAIALKVLRSRLPRGIVLNVNVPAIPYEDIRGVAVTRLAHSRWEECFVEKTDPEEGTYFLYKGMFVNMDEGLDTDVNAIEEGYVSITPIQFDLTAHGCLGVLSTWRWAEHLG